MTIDVVGYVDYKWTFDSREQCRPGYSKTVTEELSLELGKPRRAKLQIVGGNLLVPTVKGGSATLRTTVGGYQTTNYCPPQERVKLPEPSCKARLSSTLSALVSTLDPNPNDNDLTPLGAETQISLYRTRPERQLVSCHEERPKIRTEREREGWSVDPYAGLTIPIGVSNVKFWKLKPGQKLTGTTKIGGGCGKGTAHTSAIPSTVKSCTLKGKVITIITRVG